MSEIIVAVLSIWTGVGLSLLFFLAEEKNFEWNWRVSLLCGPILTSCVFLGVIIYSLCCKISRWAVKS